MMKEYWIIYVLKLENDCWYVGRTTQKAFKNRMNSHWGGRGSWFTIENRPIKLHDIEVYPRSLSGSEAEFYENKRTLKIRHDTDNESVRGGGYTQRQPHWPED
jgi:predicted GIY-YIG superfamily endonuclease